MSRKHYPLRKISGKLHPVHRLVAESALGRRLPVGAVVHHVDENPANNDRTNLVICPSRAYHNILHARMRAREACGNANWWRCNFCGAYDAPINLRLVRRNVYHLPCRAAYVLSRKKAAKATQPTENLK